MIRMVGFDPEGTRRVWGEAKTIGDAFKECKLAAKEYVEQRPDTGPLDRWGFASDKILGRNA